ncbi:MAG: hypothetical protein HKO76_02940, partial [Acidimicrobiia bacterium]|nr:hypothetical protein [Acidimicrobiia bacterium]
MPRVTPNITSDASAALTAVLALVLITITQGAAAQIDASIHGDRMVESDMYGVGATLFIPVKGYQFDFALGSQYFFAKDDSTSAFGIDLDVHSNLFVIRFLRPYTGIGLGYLNRDGRDRVGLNLKGGVYVQFSNRLV